MNGLLLLVALQAAVAAADALFDAGRHEEALSAYRKAADRFRDCGRCALGMAEAHYQLGGTREVVRQGERALRLGLPGGMPRARAHLVRGLALAREAAERPERLKESEAALRLAVQEAPEDATIRFNLGVVLLRQKREEDGGAELNACLKAGPEQALAEAALRLLEDPRRARERFAPDFEVQTLHGSRLSLAGLRGKVVILDFWATWCPPCVASLPELKDLVRRQPSERLVLISISVDDDDAKWRSFVDRQAMTWPQYRDHDDQLRKLYGVHSFPTYVVIDEEGIIRQEIRGMNQQQSVAFRLKGVLAGLGRKQD
jgi:peroxiredoxin